jgi:hypothetical protein
MNSSTTALADIPVPSGHCGHRPSCPPVTSTGTDSQAVHIVASHPEQGWTLLCNGVVHFDDTGELLPDGRVIAPHRPTDFS